MSAFCICKDQNLGPGTDAYLVRYQCQLRVSTVHSSCIQGLRENAAMRLGGLASQIQRNDRVRLPASREVKAERFHPDPELCHEDLGIGCSLPPSFLATRSGMPTVIRVKHSSLGRRNLFPSQHLLPPIFPIQEIGWSQVSPRCDSAFT